MKKKARENENGRTNKKKGGSDQKTERDETMWSLAKVAFRGRDSAVRRLADLEDERSSHYFRTLLAPKLIRHCLAYEASVARIKWEGRSIKLRRR